MSQNVDDVNFPEATSNTSQANGIHNGSESKQATEYDRVLKRGDLARVIDQKPSKPRLRNHVGNLGRIVRVTPVEGDSSSHPFLYDLEFMLGGKLGSVERSDLQYTTALAEGMIGDTKRKRKPNSVFVSSPEKKEGKTKKKGGQKKEKKMTTKKSVVSKKTASKTTPKTGKKRNASSAATKGSSKKTKVSKAVPVGDDASSNTANLYDRHRREFERSLGRLEKCDPYHWFLGDVPPEFDESYVQNFESTDEPQSDGPSKEAIAVTPSIPASPAEPPSAESMSTKKTDNKASSTAMAEKKVSQRNQEPVFPDQPPYNFHILRKRMQHGRYVIDRERLEIEEHEKLIRPFLKSTGTNKSKGGRKSKFRVLHPKAVNWDLFRKDVIGMCDSAGERNMDCDDGSAGTISHTCKKIKDTMEQIYEKMGQRHNDEITLANNRHRFASAIKSYDNNEAAMQGRWRKEAFPYRQYERLKTDVVCAGLSELDERIASYELKTNLKDSFVGLSYTYDDTEKSEAWMKSILNGAGEESQQELVASALASDDGVIKAQVAGTMQSLLIAVQDRVMTENKVLEQRELRNASWMIEAESVPETVLSASLGDSSTAPEIVEHPVWGIDCYTRRNISICLETEFDSDTVLTFVEKWLLPAINACPVDFAHDISNAARILEGLPFVLDGSVENNRNATEQWSTTLLGKALLNKIASSGPPWLSVAAHLLRKACETLGSDFFRVHPKGHGSIVLCPKLEPNKLVTFYRGEVYPSWRWGEKMDAIASIQEKKGLKPVLPDFFNMALERPMIDPRGYGLLFCDASRKSGYGSMLSHSCVPSCEVRVAAVNGELTLAMTTLREMTIGDELTFDYNAVTESLNEYQSAVCLCGHGRCRGSFLHFATADCYQQVLNRNSPVAVRLSNLVKGCMKKVMSEDDDVVLRRHGFQTAAFGAVSVNRRQARMSTKADTQLDSMEFVPIWLRTYIADTLRYIEYERRALPIALVCNQLFADDGNPKPGVSEPADAQDTEASEDDEKPIKGAKPEPTFFYYSRTQREYFLSLLMKEEGKDTLIGLELKREVQKLASTHWKTLDLQEKQMWKDKAVKEWEGNGGREKARLEEERLERLSKSKSKSTGKKPLKKETRKSDKKKCETTKLKKPEEKPRQESKITFQAADAEGISAMEQRIQQLTQTLSRVGRVLDRHREEILRQRQESKSTTTPETFDANVLRQLVHAPLSIMPDEHIVAWMWNHKDGVVRPLLRFITSEVCVSPELKQTMKDTERKFACLEQFGTPWIEGCTDVDVESTMAPAEGRERLNEALMEFRTNILEGIDDMAAEIKKVKASGRKEAAKKKKLETEKNIILRVMEDLLIAVEKRQTGATEVALGDCPERESDDKTKNTSKEGEIVMTEPWMQNFNKRFKLEKAADLLLMYARTSTFFSLNAYQPLKSSPIEVYARELGNAVPKSAIDIPKKEDPTRTCDNTSDGESSQPQSMDIDGTNKAQRKAKSSLCKPDDIIAEVAVAYQGDYVVSQLLQWYNAGIDQKPGLPDLLGCALLPSMDGIWSIDGTQGSSSRTDRATGYKSIIRARLLDWLKDPLKRGNPWPDDLRRAFVDKSEDKPIADASGQWIPFGSPILDFLVTGDDFSINTILHEMGSQDCSGASTDASGLLSSIDHGRPAQAVSNWVQCENPACLKWRKLPWHVDIDTLSDNFFCKDNKWNPNSASCDVPEDEWNEATDGVVDADGSAAVAAPAVETDTVTRERREDAMPGCELANFKLGSRFDVLRSGKEKWTVAVVVKFKVEGSRTKAKFHYLNHSIKYDEWLDVESVRVAPLHSKTPEPPKRKAPRTTAEQEGNATITGTHPMNESRDRSVTETDKHERSEPLPQSISESKENMPEAPPSPIAKSEVPNSFRENKQKSAHSSPKQPATVGKVKKRLTLKGRPPVITDDSSPASSPKGGSSRPPAREDQKNGFKPTIPRKKSQPTQAVDGSHSSRIPRKAKPIKDEGLTVLMQQKKDASSEHFKHKTLGNQCKEQSRIHDQSSLVDQERSSSNMQLPRDSPRVASRDYMDDQRNGFRRSTTPMRFENRNGGNRDFHKYKSPSEKRYSNPDGDSDRDHAGRQTSGADNLIRRNRDSIRQRRLEFDNGYNQDGHVAAGRSSRYRSKSPSVGKARRHDYGRSHAYYKDRGHAVEEKSGCGHRSKSPSVGRARRRDYYDDRRSEERYDKRNSHRYQDDRGNDDDYESRTRPYADRSYRSCRDRSDDRNHRPVWDSSSGRVHSYEHDRYRHTDELQRTPRDKVGDYDDYARKRRYNIDYDRHESDYDYEDYTRYRYRKEERSVSPRREYDRGYDKDYHYAKKPKYDRDHGRTDQGYAREYHRSTGRDDYYQYEKPDRSLHEFKRLESPQAEGCSSRDWSKRR